MNILKERTAIDAALDDYRAWLDNIPDEYFDVTPPGGGWSYAEVYSHIMQATLGSGIAVERCANGTAKPADKKRLSLLGMAVLLFGRFPPVKLTLPEALAAKMPPKKISKEDAKNLLVKCRKKVDEVVSAAQNANGLTKAQHPRLGMLNAKQWFKFMRIHLVYHLKQLGRIQKEFHSV